VKTIEREQLTPPDHRPRALASQRAGLEEEVVRHPRDHIARDPDADEVRTARGQTRQSARVRGVDGAGRGTRQELGEPRDPPRVAAGRRLEVDAGDAGPRRLRGLGHRLDSEVNDLEGAFEEGACRERHRVTSAGSWRSCAAILAARAAVSSTSTEASRRSRS
jgi:hypothetical protein